MKEDRNFNYEKEINRIPKKIKKRRSYRRLVLTLSVLVVFVMTYMLILPAITLDEDEALRQGGIDIESVNIEETAADDLVAEEIVAETETEVEAEAEPVPTSGVIIAETDEYKVSLSYKADAGIPEGAELSVREVIEETSSEGRGYDEYMAAAENLLEANEKITFARFFDITIVKDGEEIQPLSPVDVRVELTDTLSEDVKALHFEEEKDEDGAPVGDVTAVLLEASVAEGEKLDNAVDFEADSFSVYGVVETTVIEKDFLASDGSNYKVTVNYGADAGIPEDAELEVTELTGEEYEDYLGRSAVFLDAAGFEYARIFDITIYDSEHNKIQPEADVNVTIELADADSDDDFSVIHFKDDEPEEMTAETDGTTVSFETGSFSAYAIVQGPGELPQNWIRYKTLDDIGNLNGKGIIIGSTGGYYLTNRSSTVQSSGTATNGIVKTKPAQNHPSSDAALYYFEAAEGQSNAYYIYCFDEDGNKVYIYSTGDTGDAHLYLRQDQKTPFEVLVDNTGRFRFRYNSRYWNMWNGDSGNGIATYTSATDGNNYFYIWDPEEQATDPYELNGKTYGFMNWIGGVTGRAVMAEEQSGNALKALPMTVMTKSNLNDRLFVPDNSDISLWTFEYVGNYKYHLYTTIDGSKKYLKISSSGVSLASQPDDDCLIEVVPGTGTYAGMIHLSSANGTLTYSGKVEDGFKNSGSSGNEWLYLVDVSELTDQYFLTYSATKASVSDPSITNGSRVIVYTRVWNDTTKKYEFYAVDSDGSLHRVFESGDTIEWVGSRLNSLLWNFVEYYWEGTTDPNYYYELYNQYSEKYIAPQVTGGQILSDNTIGINMDGRRNGAYYSEIVAWDDPNYAFVGLKADLETNTIVSCPKSEADDFYFAILDEIPVDDQLTYVETIDNNKYGITMKMINFRTGTEMTSFLGSKYVSGNSATGGAVDFTEDNLLTTDLKENGYPDVAKDGNDNNLSSWFANADAVNHLFLQSTYNESGYFEYDATQNFAKLSNTGDFILYNEIGTINSGGVHYQHGQFFPYNDLKAGTFASVSNRNMTTSGGQPLPPDDPRKGERLYLVTNPDYYMGMEVNATFTQTPDGLDDWGHDIIYEFTGDDDFWLYVDGELIIDLGGVHNALSGSVNYRTGEVIINSNTQYKTVTNLRALFESNYRGRNPDATDEQVTEYLNQYFKEGTTVFKDYTTHTMKIFYLERGAGASNLHMRFNLASVKPGTVQLSKKLSGVDSTESVLAEFPYQIIYETENPNGEKVEHWLTNSVKDDPTRINDYVFYKGTTTPVKYQTNFSVDGITYRDVFFLDPNEVAEIDFSKIEGFVDYKIIECGVNTTVYDRVTANGNEITGTDTNPVSANRQDFGIDYDTPDKRAKVDYVNHVNPDAIRNIRITKKLYNETGTVEINYPDDETEFSFRLYLATEFVDEDLIEEYAANMHTYHVKDADGNYCEWNATEQKFKSLEETVYDNLTDEQKTKASFHTSIFGSISKIPADHTVEIRNVLAGTQFKVQERDYEVPDGYSFQKYLYNIDDPSVNRESTDANAGIIDTVVSGIDNHVQVNNLKGWGIRVNKTWTDKDYMAGRAATYFAIYYDEGEGHLALLDGSVRQMVYGTDTIYWYYPHLPIDGSSFDRYVIREVKLVGNPITVDSETGEVSGYSSIVPVEDGSTIVINGTQTGETGSSGITYTVEYGDVETGANNNVRTFPVTNDRPGIRIIKTDWEENPLGGADFTFRQGDNVLGNYTSGSDGLITIAFLRNDTYYTLEETKAPSNYQGLDNALTITQSANGTISVSGVSDLFYEIIQPTASSDGVIMVKNRSKEFKVTKIDGETGKPLAEVHFALHKQITVDGVVDFDLNPMPGYEDLVSNADGVILNLNNDLPAGTYQLREKRAASGYINLPSHIVFTKTEMGVITLGAHPNGVELRSIDQEGSVSYDLRIPNIKFQVSFVKTDIADENIKLEGAVFDLYRSTNGVRDSLPLISGLTSGADGVLKDGTKTTFSLDFGEYQLIETKAPDGYNKKVDPVMIHINPNIDGTPDFDVVTYDEGTVVSQDGTSVVYDETTHTFTLRLTNSAGQELPMTGGPGTAAFTILGCLLIGTSLILLRYRMKRR